LKVLVVASECVPFAKTGGLGDVVGALPKALARRGHEVWVMLPRYSSVAPGKVVERGLEIPMGNGRHAVDIHEGQTRSGVRHFFVEYPPYFDRQGLYQVQGRNHPDNAERFALFSKAVLEFLQRTERPDVVHCHDWQSALVPVLLKAAPLANSRIGRVPVILTVHNLGYQGAFPADAMERIGLPGELFAVDGLESRDRVNFLKGGMLYADYITTVSRRYAEEIQTPECGHGLDPVVRQRADSLAGILNGVDYAEWNPETDPHIAANYSSAKLEGKQLCRADLLRQFHLSEGEGRRPVVGIVSRFASQKGFDLIAEAANALMRENLFLVALGTGEPMYEELFRQLAARHPNKCAVRIAFDNALAHKIEAGSDIFLMPSKYEPCGLNQIYSLKYGTVPVVRAVGGLDDTVVPFDAGSGAGTGFKFTPYSGGAMLDALRGAIRLYRQDPTAWLKLIRNGMQQDFSWETSAAQYERHYHQVSRGNVGSPAS
jgi:starch synthase